jgi:hypothetical protein
MSSKKRVNYVYNNKCNNAYIWVYLMYLRLQLIEHMAFIVILHITGF